MKDLLRLYEEIINELEDSTVNSLTKKREEARMNAWSDFLKAKKEGTPDEVVKASEKDTDAKNKWDKAKTLASRRVLRKLGEQRRIKDLQDKLINQEQTPRQTKEAGTAHGDAQINQYRRNKLEKIFNKKSAKSAFESVVIREFQNILEADMSNVCMEEILQRIGDFLFEKAEEDKKVIDFEREKIAKQVNDMMKSGETDKVKQTSTGQIIGNPEVVAKLNALKSKLNELNSKKKDN